MGVASVYPLQPSQDHRQNTARSRRRRRHRSADAGDHRVFWCAVVLGESADRASERARDHARPSLRRLHILLLQLPHTRRKPGCGRSSPSSCLHRAAKPARALLSPPWGLTLAQPSELPAENETAFAGREIGAACSSCTACRLSFVRQSVMLPRWRLVPELTTKYSQASRADCAPECVHLQCEL